MSTETSIKVVCKFRPLNALEKEMGGETCVEMKGDTVILVPSDPSLRETTFTFDKVFGPQTGQQQVFDFVGKPLLKRKSISADAMNGFNGTIFAYGQTSSGKTFTMEGRGLDDQEYKGLIPRVMDEIFEMIMAASDKFEFTIRVTMLEIYNERIQDLLDTNKNNLQVREDKKHGVYVADATEIYVNNPQEMREVMQIGSDNRSVAETRMNANSSRSHSIFCMKINKKNLETEESTESRLYFVDLAGSEKISKTHVQGKELDEAKNINKSLTTLGLVINALVENSKFVPYRNSKLTRILQESIGGNSLTTLVIACSMCTYNEKETLSTLQFGQRAKCIKNNVVANIERSAKELERLLEIAELKVKEYENIIKKLTAGEKIPFPLITPAIQTQQEVPMMKEEVINEVKASPESPVTQTQPVPAPKPKKKICYSIGIQTDPLPEPEPKAKKNKKKVSHEEVDMLEGMNSEEELAYLQRMEEEALKKLEEEDNRLKDQKEKEKVAKIRSNLIIQELDPDYEDSPQSKPGTLKHFTSKQGSNKDIEVPEEKLRQPENDSNKDQAAADKGPSEAAYIAQTLQLIDKNLELKKVREEKEIIEDELRLKKEEIDDLKEKLFDSQEVQRTFQLACRSFVEKIKRSTDRALEEAKEKVSKTLKLARDLDEVKLKLIFISNDSDLKNIIGNTASEVRVSDSVSELKSFLQSTSDKIVELRKDGLNEKSLEMTSKLRELDENLIEFIQICNNSPTSKLLDYIGATTDDPEAIDGPLNTDSIEADQTMLVGLLNPLESARSQPRSPSKLKLRDAGGTCMSQDDSFLQPLGEEQEIHKIVQTQRKTIEKLNKEQVILENKISALKKKIEEMSLQAKKKTKEMKSMIQQKMAQNKNSNDAEKAQLTAELITLRKELNENQAGMTERGTKISQLAAENESLKKILQTNDHTKQILNLEGHLSKLAIERQSFFNMKFDMENQILEKDDLLAEKNTQISMLKAQINILTRELDEAKKNSHQDGGLSSLTPLKMVKKIRGGNHQASSKNISSLPGDYNETEATDMPSGRIQNPPYKQGGTFVTTANSIFTHRSTTNKLESADSVNTKSDIQEVALKPLVSSMEPQEKQIEKTPKLTKEEEKAKISQSIEEFKKLHLAKSKKANQGTQPGMFSDRRGSDSLFGQFKSFITGSNPSSQ